MAKIVRKTEAVIEILPVNISIYDIIFDFYG